MGFIKSLFILDKNSAPIIPPIIPGNSIFFTTLISILPALKCDKPENKVVNISEKWTLELAINKGYPKNVSVYMANCIMNSCTSLHFGE